MTDDIEIESWEDCLYKADAAWAQGLIDENRVESYAKHLAEKYKIPVED